MSTKATDQPICTNRKGGGMMTMSDAASVLALSQRDFEVFAEAVEHPPKPEAALMRLMGRARTAYAGLVRS
jgi:hypothetical protein